MSCPPYIVTTADVKADAEHLAAEWDRLQLQWMEHESQIDDDQTIQFSADYGSAIVAAKLIVSGLGTLGAGPACDKLEKHWIRLAHWRQVYETQTGNAAPGADPIVTGGTSWLPFVAAVVAIGVGAYAMSQVTDAAAEVRSWT